MVSSWLNRPADRLSAPRILLLGGDADFNLGDTAILHAICQCLFALNPRVQISLTSRRADAAAPPGVVRIARRGLLGFYAYYCVAAAQDLIILGGGGLLQDDDSRIKMPYWAALFALLGRRGTPIAALSLGAGPIRHWESRRSARRICRSMFSISVRDQFAHGWLEPCVGRRIDIVPDPAFMLKPASDASGKDFVRGIGLDLNRPIIGVALRRWFHRLGGVIPHQLRARMGLGRDTGQHQLDAMLTKLAAAFVEIAGLMDAQLLLMPSYTVSHEADDAVCARLAAQLPGLDVRLARIEDPALYKSVAGQLSLMISARMHPLILAASMNVPIVGLAYNGKFEGLFDLLGLPRRLVWLHEFAGNAAQSRLVAFAREACREPIDLRATSTRLSEVVRQRTAQLLHLAEERAMLRARP